MQCYYDNREMYEHAASSNDSNHHASTPATWFASGMAYHRRRYRNLGSWISWRSYTIVGYKLCDVSLEQFQIEGCKVRIWSPSMRVPTKHYNVLRTHRHGHIQLYTYTLLLHESHCLYKTYCTFTKLANLLKITLFVNKTDQRFTYFLSAYPIFYFTKFTRSVEPNKQSLLVYIFLSNTSPIDGVASRTSPTHRVSC